jgi:hypothetical protein
MCGIFGQLRFDVLVLDHKLVELAAATPASVEIAPAD